MSSALTLDDGDIQRICVIGGGGFVGRHVVPVLSAARYQVTVPTRLRDRAKHLILLPTVDVVQADVNDEAQLAQLLSGQHAVINLAGTLHDGGSYGLQQTHVELTRKIIAGCKSSGVRRLLHVSALGAAADAPSRYLKTKAEGEALVRDSGLDWTVFRPSVIFGRGDRFLNRFAMLLKIAPVLFLASPNARFQPVFADDVAHVMTRSLTDINTYGQSYDLCGAKVYTLRELAALTGEIIGHRRPIIGLGSALSNLQAAILGHLPGKLLTRDNLLSMQVDNISAAPLPFGILPTSLEAEAQGYLGGITPRGRYRFYRDQAGRGGLS